MHTRRCVGVGIPQLQYRIGHKRVDKAGNSRWPCANTKFAMEMATHTVDTLENLLYQVNSSSLFSSLFVFVT